MNSIQPYYNSPDVTLVTALAEATDLTDALYRAIYDRVAQGRSLRNIELALRSEVSFGWWAKYAAGEKGLDRARKNELRRWSGLPDLPPSVAESIAAHTHPDAAVYQVGADIASRVVMVGADVDAITLRINGNCRIAAENDSRSLDAPVARCNGRYSGPPTRAIRLHLETFNRLSTLKTASGLSWDEFGALVADRVAGDPPLRIPVEI